MYIDISKLKALVFSYDSPNISKTTKMTNSSSINSEGQSVDS